MFLARVLRCQVAEKTDYFQATGKRKNFYVARGSVESMRSLSYARAKNNLRACEDQVVRRKVFFRKQSKQSISKSKLSLEGVISY